MSVVEKTPWEQLIAAFAAFQGEVRSPAKNKTATVPGKDGRGGYKYSYADIADVLAAALPVLSKHGLALSQTLSISANGMLIINTKVLHAAGGILEGGDLFAGSATATMQTVGGNLTYARRYAACTVLGIAAEEDTDGPMQSSGPAPRPPPPRPSSPPPARKAAPPPPEPEPEGPTIELTAEQRADEDAFLTDLDIIETKEQAGKVWEKWKPRFRETMSEDLVKLMYSHVQTAVHNLINR